MSETFKGFTDQDLKNIKMKKDVNHITNSKVKLQVKNNENIPDETISKSKEEVDTLPLESILTEDKTIDEKLTNLNSIENNNNEENILNDNKKIEILNGPHEDFKIIIEKPINVKDFQIQQKLMEEQNRKRKEMLAKALDDRQKQTAEEALRIEKIKKELQALDAQLSDDVSILRKQIDKSSLSYMEAEKSYHKIEMEFLAAKLHLQKEKERKEMLTEHLCTLIAHNEARKAKRLESLMEQLVYSSAENLPSHVCDGVCEKTGKMVEYNADGICKECEL